MKFSKKFVAVGISALLASNTVPVFAELPDISVKIDGKTIEFDVPPMIISDRTMVPMRKIFEEFGYVVDWNGDEQFVIADGLNSVYMKIGESTMKVDGEEIQMDTPPQIVDGRTLIPLRALAESIGCYVDWDGETRTVDISTPAMDGIDYYGAYKGILEQVIADNVWGEYLRYFVYDIDGDGVKELIVQNGNNELEMALDIYTVYQEEALLLGSLTGGHSALYPCPDGGIYRHWANEGSETLYRITLNGRDLKEELIWDKQEPHNDYAQFEEGDLHYARITDDVLLR